MRPTPTSLPPAMDRGDPWGTTVLAAAAGLVVLVAVFYGAAQVAALAAAREPLPVPVEAALPALRELPGHLDEPEAAWPEPARAVLPAAPGYYGSLAGTVAVAVGSGMACVRGTRGLRRRVHALGVEPHAGFARPRDVRRLAVHRPVEGRVTLGRVGRRLVACEHQASLAVVGPTGCGKTAGFAIPALLEWRGPVIATSVKADLLAATIDHRRRQGTVWVYDPTGSSGQPTGSWSPLEACRTWAGALRIAAWLSEAAQPRLDTVSDGDYWYTQARKGLAPYLHAAAASGRTMRDVVRWVDTQDDTEAAAALRQAGGFDDRVAQRLASTEGRRRMAELRDQLRGGVVEAVRRSLYDEAAGRTIAGRPLSKWPRQLVERVEQRLTVEADRAARAEAETDVYARYGSTPELAPLIAAKALWGKEARLRSSVYATMENVLSGYADPGVAGAADHPDPGRAIDLDAWLGGNNTIYVVAAAHEQARLRPVLTVLVQQAIRAAYDTAAARGGRLAIPALVLLDEAGNIAPLRDLPAYASTARSHAITIVSVWQDLAQIRAIYHDRAHTVLNNHRAKLFGTGIADEATLAYVSRLVGDEARTEHNRSTDLTGGRHTVSEHVAYRPTAPIDVLRRMRENQAVLVYGNQLPAHVRLRPWYRDQRLRRLAAPPPAAADTPEGRM